MIDIRKSGESVQRFPTREAVQTSHLWDELQNLTFRSLTHNEWVSWPNFLGVDCFSLPDGIAY